MAPVMHACPSPGVALPHFPAWPSRSPDAPARAEAGQTFQMMVPAAQQPLAQSQPVYQQPPPQQVYVQQPPPPVVVQQQQPQVVVVNQGPPVMYNDGPGIGGAIVGGMMAGAAFGMMTDGWGGDDHGWGDDCGWHGGGFDGGWD
jgi:hypothetical protein